MKKLIAAIVLLSIVAQGRVSAGEAPAAGPLQRYVAKEDASYKWVRRNGGPLGDGAYVELILTSQTWRDIVWKHQLFLFRPSTAGKETTHALLFITGGKWSDRLDRPPAKDVSLPGEAQLFAALAEQLKTPVVILRHVPFQPIFDGMVEDQIISMTFEKFIRTRDPEWPLLAPMVKSAVRAMDAATEFAKQNWSMSLKTFTVTGASKRGWTTWLVGAVDGRVAAIAPMVIDMLNMGPQMKHQLAAWGDYSYMIEDYTRRGLQKHLDTEAGRQLQAIVDPYSYRRQLTQPKLILLGTNDPYWPLDALNLYWSDLVGPKYILYVPNNGHGLHDYPRMIGSLAALHRHAVTGAPLPKLSWKFDREGEREGGRLSLRITSDIRPRTVSAWVATSPTRDFRKARWESHAATVDGKAYVYRLEVPKRGYAAMFGEATYDGRPMPYYLSTNVQITGAPQRK